MVASFPLCLFAPQEAAEMSPQRALASSLVDNRVRYARYTRWNIWSDIIRIVLLIELIRLE